MEKQIEVLAWETLLKAKETILNNWYSNSEPSINLKLVLNQDENYLRGDFSDVYSDERCKDIFNVESKIIL